jgi:FkbM family methyltransferase
MQDNVVKQFIKRLYFPPGALRRIRFGPLRGMVFRVSDITGLSPWYSGGEHEHQQTFKKLVQPGDTVVDIGANWGVHTLYLSRLVGHNGVVVAVEPFPPAYTELRWHIRANACTNVQVLAMAVSETSGEALFTPGSSASTGSLSTVWATSVTPRDQLSVITRTLDSVIEELGISLLKLVKIDVEGAESKVLSGAKRVVEQYHPYFVIDLHTPEQDVLVAHLLTSWGYTLSRLSGPAILRTDTGWPDPAGVWGSIVATPPF